MTDAKTKYADIIDLPHHVSKKHPHMSIRDRAGQFAPFAALTGHEEAVKETARLTDTRIDLDEGEIEVLNDKLQQLVANIDSAPLAEFTYFMPDPLKEGGKYVTIKGHVRKIDMYLKQIIMEDLTAIKISEIIKINIF